MGEPSPAPGAPDLADQFEAALWHHSLDPWYPRAVDDQGGFFTHLDYRWEPTPNAPKFVVGQARHVWTASTASLRPGAPAALREAADHGYTFLRDAFLDEDGGLHSWVTRAGEPRDPPGGLKLRRTYHQAFALYALCAYHRATGSDESLELAKRAFAWLERSAHDAEHGGYARFVDEAGAPLLEAVPGHAPRELNASLHLMEALAALLGVWPADPVRIRLREMLHIVRDGLALPAGYLRMFAERDGSAAGAHHVDPASPSDLPLDHVSFGHDIETAWLLLDAVDRLGRPEDPRTAEVARRLVDHTLAAGWDRTRGGVFEAGVYRSGTCQILRPVKPWWAQAEALAGLTVMSTAGRAWHREYRAPVERIWAYIRAHLIDWQYGGWYREALDRSPDAATAPKAAPWKTNFHDARALMLAADRMRAAG